MDPAEYEMLRRELSTPDLRPSDVDVTVDGWMFRVELWGKLKIRHKDPENHRNEEISKSQFLSRLSDKNLLKMCGKWRTQERDMNKLTMYRDYIGMDGRQYREEFLIDIELRDEIKKAVKPKGFWGWF